MISKSLQDGAQQLGVPLDPQQIELLLGYLALLKKWNKAYNLTAIRAPEEMVSKHLLDSLAIQPYINRDRIIDVGTGAGLPGIPLAILNKEKSFTLLDSNSKKTRFLVQCKMELQLNNVEVVHSRVEEFRPEQRFDIVLSRAFSSLENMTQWCAHLVSDSGAFFAMKGQFPEQELAQIRQHYTLEHVKKLPLPGCEAERHLLIISK